MKEFEKWDSEFCNKECPLKKELRLDDSCVGCIAARKAGWRAALDWLWEELCNYHCVDLPQEIIAEELGEE